MNSQPDFSLSIKHTPQVAPSNSKVWLSFNCFQITRLVFDQGANIARNGKQEQAMQSKTKKQSKANKQKMQQVAERT